MRDQFISLMSEKACLLACKVDVLRDLLEDNIKRNKRLAEQVDLMEKAGANLKKDLRRQEAIMMSLKKKNSALEIKQEQGTEICPLEIAILDINEHGVKFYPIKDGTPISQSFIRKGASRYFPAGKNQYYGIGDGVRFKMGLP